MELFKELCVLREDERPVLHEEEIHTDLGSGSAVSSCRILGSVTPNNGVTMTTGLGKTAQIQLGPG